MARCGSVGQVWKAVGIQLVVAMKKMTGLPLKGWRAIAAHLGQAIAVAQPCGKSGMPVRLSSP